MQYLGSVVNSVELNLHCYWSIMMPTSWKRNWFYKRHLSKQTSL